ncbi:MAG TPA: hypothetical protein VNU71_08980, partial [Burkholderiaceae bacterium]|nr:hypothetical protein [Burkholderiaceae bacterium]
MSTTGAVWARVLAAAWQQRRNTGSVRVWAVLGALAVIVLAVCAATLRREVAFWLLTSMLATAVVGAWGMLVANLLQQNEPHAARLVPTHVSALRRVAGAVAAGYVVVALATALAFGLETAAALAIGLAAFATLLVVAWLVRWPVLGMFGWLVPASQASWSRTAPARALGAAVASEWQREPGTLLVAGALAAAALAAWSLRS